MKVNFLSAKLPLTKTLDAQGKTLSSYPLIKNFTSHEHHIARLEDLVSSLAYFSKLGCCMLKGTLSRAIDNEPRAGLTSSLNPTKLFVLDYDADAVVGSVDELLYAIHPALVETDHIIQWSASAGFSPGSALRCHVFFMLTEEVSPELLKNWVLDKNYRVPLLRDQLRLSANGMSLRHPLDQTVNQNDKLIFISPPIVQDGEDPIPARIVFNKRDNAELSLQFPGSKEQLTAEKDIIIKDLRKALSLPARTPRSKIVNGEEILTNPGRLTVTGQKKERGFIYLNVNGGDSWGYYFSEKNPSIVRNFKGEPFFYLKDAAPELYAEFTRRMNGNLEGFPIVFRDSNTDKYYNAVVDNGAVIRLATASNKDRLHDFLAQFGVDEPPFIPDWTLTFDPTTDEQYNEAGKWMNTFTPTQYMATEASSTTMPRVLGKVIKHVCVDQETYAHFINWLAFIFQTRTMSKTAWVFHGTTGTGKGFLFHQIIRTLFGHKYTQGITLGELDEKFNGYMENKLFVFVDEIDFDHMQNAGKAFEKLKNHITEPTISLRAMRSDSVGLTNYANFIFASNTFAPIPIPENDRRFNVAPRQESKLPVPKEELAAALEIEMELLAAYLRGYTVNALKAQTPLLNEARRLLIDTSKTSVEEFFEALKNGDLEYFTGSIQVGTDLCISAPEDEVRKIVRGWITETKARQTCKVTTAELGKVYTLMQGGAFSLNKFGRMCVKNNMPVRSVRINGVVLRGFDLRFRTTDNIQLFDMLAP